ncbi:MAG: hypothetical protein IKY82_04370 [Alistipes sp.]|nr:hypothetical protein [Alistipes sp.]
MIKRIIGYIITIVVLGVLVFVVLNAGNYKSLLPEDLFSPSAEIMVETDNSPAVSDSADDAATE